MFFDPAAISGRSNNMSEFMAERLKQQDFILPEEKNAIQRDGHAREIAPAKVRADFVTELDLHIAHQAGKTPGGTPVLRRFEKSVEFFLHA